MMRVIVQVGPFRAAVAKAAALAARHCRADVPPVLRTLRLAKAAEQPALSVTGGDGGMSATLWVPVLSSDPGAVCVDAARLARILRPLPADETLTIRQVGERLHLDLPFGRMALMVTPAEDYPETPFEPRKAEPIAVPASVLRDAFARLAPLMAREETRYYLNGICLHTDAGALVAVATEGRILGKIPLGVAVDRPKLRVIVPAKAVRWLVRNMAVQGSALVTFGPDRDMRVVSGDASLTTRLIDGDFPDYPRVFPKGEPVRLQVGRAKTLSALRLIGDFVDLRVACRFVGQPDGRFAVTARDEFAGEIALAVPVVAPERSLAIGLDVCVNVHLLEAAFEAIRGDEITLEVRKAAERHLPLVLTGADGAVVIVMPMADRAHLGREPSRDAEPGPALPPVALPVGAVA